MFEAEKLKKIRKIVLKLKIKKIKYFLWHIHMRPNKAYN